MLDDYQVRLLIDAEKRAQLAGEEASRGPAEKSAEDPLRGQLVAVQRQYGVPEYVFRALQPAAATILYDFHPRLDPQYLMAWEEALLRPNPWQVKFWFVKTVIDCGEPASVPVLGETMRRAIRDRTGQIACATDLVPELIIPVLINRPSRADLEEISETIRYAEVHDIPALRRRFGYALSRLKAWGDLLDSLQYDREYAPHVDRVRRAMLDEDAAHTE